jgi:hypothetical protein
MASSNAIQPIRKNQVKGMWLKPWQNTLALLASNSVYALGSMKAATRKEKLLENYKLAINQFLNDSNNSRLSNIFVTKTVGDREFPLRVSIASGAMNV